jgi:hypothetical protein
MLSCGIGGAHCRWTILARAWGCFNRMIGSLLGTVATGFAAINSLVEAVASGLLMIAVVTLGANALRGNCYMSTPCFPTLGFGMDLLKVTFFTATLLDFTLVRMSFNFCNVSISSPPFALMRCRRANLRLPTALMIWLSGVTTGLVMQQGLEENHVRDLLTLCLTTENVMAMVMLRRGAQIPSA